MTEHSAYGSRGATLARRKVHISLDANKFHVDVGVVVGGQGINLRAQGHVLDVHHCHGEPPKRRWSLQLRVEVRSIIMGRGSTAEAEDGEREDVRVFVAAEKLVADAQLVAPGPAGIIIDRQLHRSRAPEAAAEVVLGVTSKVGSATIVVDERADRRRRG